MKRRFQLLLLVMQMLPAVLNAQNQVLVLWHANGSTTDVELDTEPTVTFTEDKMQITSTVLDMEFDAEEIVRFTFKGLGSGIDAPKDDVGYLVKDNRIVFHQLEAASSVAVYRSDGIRMPVNLSVEDGNVVLLLSSLPQGTYIMSVNGKNVKFLRK